MVERKLTTGGNATLQDQKAVHFAVRTRSAVLLMPRMIQSIVSQFSRRRQVSMVLAKIQELQQLDTSTVRCGQCAFLSAFKRRKAANNWGSTITTNPRIFNSRRQRQRRRPTKPR